MKIKRMMGILTGVLAAGCLVFAGCNKKSGLKDTLDAGLQNEQPDEKPSGNTIVKDPDKEVTDENDLNLNGKEVSREIDLSSEDLIREFIAGEGTMIDRNKREDFATLSIRSNGSFDFTRLKDNASGYGKIYFDRSLSSEDEEPDSFRMEFDGLDELVPADR